MDTHALRNMAGITILDVAKEKFLSRTGYHVTSAEYLDSRMPPTKICRKLFKAEFIEPHCRTTLKVRNGERNTHYMLPNFSFKGAWLGCYTSDSSYYAVDFISVSEMTELQLDAYNAAKRFDWDTFCDLQIITEKGYRFQYA